MALAGRLVIGVAPWRDPAAVQRAVLGWVDNSLNALADAGRGAFVAVADTGVVGLVTLGTRTHFTGQLDAYVGELIVAELMERRGIGGLLIRAAELWAAERGFEYLTLETGAANNGARAFYASLGYCEEDVRITKRIESQNGLRTQ